ncbi:MAG: glycosyltransferase family 4 protein [Candidatus Aminicenantes bacterium]|nr:glycosyltransferase family 4 protein [Candidatus Aminicenantes bacterium]
MRIAVVTSHVPFIEGGHLIIARSTVKALQQAGHEAEMILTPQNRFDRIFQAYLANWLTDVSEDGLGRKIDQVISFRFPSFAVRHPIHVNWLNHRFREYYDLWDQFSANLSWKNKIKEYWKRWLLHRLDNYLLKRKIKKIYAQSRTIQERLRKWGGINSEVLYPPPPQRPYRLEKYGDFILAVSRLQKLKRFDLLIKAVSLLGSFPGKVMIIGDGPEKPRLASLIKEKNLENKIILTGWTDEDTLIKAYAECRAVFFGPYQEDYGLVTVEAFSSGKAVITCHDSGGPTELVSLSKGGLVVSPEPESIAEAINQILLEPSLAENLGKRAFEFVKTINWEETIKKLTLAV